MKIVSSGSPALAYKDEIISYESLIGRVSYLSQVISLKEGDRAAIFLENRPEWVCSFLAVWHDKGINVPVDAMSNEEEVAHILKDSSPSLVFISNGTKEVMEKAISLAKIKAKIFNVDDAKFNEFGTVDEEPNESLNFEEYEDSTTAVMIYTSGTTGKPKGVELTFGNLKSNSKAVIDLGIFKKEERILGVLQLHHSYPLTSLVLIPLQLGAMTILVDKASSEDIFRALEQHKATIIIGVPRLFNLMHKGIMRQIEESRVARMIFKIAKPFGYWMRRLFFRRVHRKFGGHVNVLASGGAKLDPTIANDFERMGFHVLEGYGLSETSPIISFNTFKNNRLGTVGKPIDEVKVKIVDGEVVVSGPNVMKGYYNLEKESEKVLKDGWFYTGDLGSIDRDGYLSITGRRKEMIVLSNGKNVDPIEIENKLLKHSPYAKEVAIVQKNDFLHALIYPDFQELSKDKILNIEETIKWEIIDRYNSSALDYKKISDFKVLDKEMPKTRLGKLKRFLLIDMLKSNDKRDEDIVEPENVEYRILKDYLEKNSGGKVSPKDHIELNLGLDSIEKVDLQFFIERKFGFSMNSDEFSQRMVLEDLANYVAENRKTIAEDDELSNNSNLEEIDIDVSKSGSFLFKALKKLLTPIFRRYFKMEIKGLENIPKENNFILAPNHQSFLDAQLISASLPYEVLKDTYFLATEEFFQSRLKKLFARKTNIITINVYKNLKLVLEKLDFLLKNGKNVLIFPEGAITKDGNLYPFKNAFAILAKQSGVPIVPVTIKGAREALPYEASFPKRSKIIITFSEPFGGEGMSYDDISKRTRKVIEENLDMEGVK